MPEVLDCSNISVLENSNIFYIFWIYLIYLFFLYDWFLLRSQFTIVCIEVLQFLDNFLQHLSGDLGQIRSDDVEWPELRLRSCHSAHHGQHQLRGHGAVVTRQLLQSHHQLCHITNLKSLTSENFCLLFDYSLD